MCLAFVVSRSSDPAAERCSTPHAAPTQVRVSFLRFVPSLVLPDDLQMLVEDRGFTHSLALDQNPATLVPANLGTVVRMIPA